MEEEKVEKFTIFKNTYKLLRHLPEKNKTELYDAMFDYMFEGIEPSFNDELSDGIWVNLKMILDNTKSRILNGKKGGRNSGTNELGYENQEPNHEPNISLGRIDDLREMSLFLPLSERTSTVYFLLPEVTSDFP